jgi:DNA-binding beta-propeller fold protein YncE
VSPDSSKVFVGQQTANVSVINTATKAVSTIVTGGPVRDLTITPDGSTVYLAMEFSGLRKIDTASNGVSAVSSIVCPEAVAVTPDGARLYVNYQCGGPGGSAGHDAIGIFDAASGAFLGSITGLPNVGAAIAISPDGTQLWANGYDACSSPAYDHVGCPFVGSGVVNIVDTGTNTRIGSIGSLGFGPGFITFTSDSSLAIVDSGPSLMLFETLTFTRLGQAYAVK